MYRCPPLQIGIAMYVIVEMSLWWGPGMNCRYPKKSANIWRFKMCQLLLLVSKDLVYSTLNCCLVHIPLRRLLVNLNWWHQPVNIQHAFWRRISCCVTPSVANFGRTTSSPLHFLAGYSSGLVHHGGGAVYSSKWKCWTHPSFAGKERKIRFESWCRYGGCAGNLARKGLGPFEAPPCRDFRANPSWHIHSPKRFFLSGTLLTSNSLKPFRYELTNIFLGGRP